MCPLTLAVSADTLTVMDEEFRSLADRLGDEAGESAAYRRLLATEDDEELARVLVERERPLWAREIAAFRLGCGGDRRAFEALVLLLNHRDPERCVSAAHALVRLGDPRTPRPPPPSRPTPCVPPTPCTRCGCSPPCGPPSPSRR